MNELDQYTIYLAQVQAGALVYAVADFVPRYKVVRVDVPPNPFEISELKKICLCHPEDEVQFVAKCREANITLIPVGLWNKAEQEHWKKVRDGKTVEVAKGSELLDSGE